MFLSHKKYKLNVLFFLWISNAVHLLTRSFLFQGVVDTNGFEKIQEKANETKALATAGRWVEAETAWRMTNIEIFHQASIISHYNVLAKMRTSRPDSFLSAHLNYILKARVTEIMNSVKRTLKLRTTWDAQYAYVRRRLLHEYMKPAVNIGTF